ncbi:MAG TPA: hypothetical protein VFP80_13015 [Thermoanaerobaculia bacterium]|nr:hypothetical protein [Thermoanaerobaculia bacterium]
MSTSNCFNTGFLVSDQPDEEVFLSVTPGLEGGPGIERDGVTYPRMQDPHTIDGVRSQHGLDPDPQPSRMTTDAWEQRAGTWTVYQHVREFMERRPDLLVVGVQSNGDLTMNPWHIAYIGESHLRGQQERLCGLLHDEPREPVQSRTYRCLVKWKSDVARAARGRRYDFLNLRVQKTPPRGRYTLKLYDLGDFPDRGAWLGAHECYAKRRDIGPLVEFALAGKPIVERSLDLSLASAIDRFQDVRHVFDLPEVRVSGAFRGSPVKSVNLGEYQLFGSLNERRAALSSAVVIDLDVRDVIRIDPATLRDVLLENHFRPVSESPARPGQFRMYEAEAHRCRVEIFFPHNVYPFGALGMHARTAAAAADQLVCLSAGGLSGRVGNTLEGITRIMYDFFGCSDAMILDEGLDVCSVVNRGAKDDNPALLRKILRMVRTAVAADQRQVQERHPETYEYVYGEDFRKWPLNRAMMDEIAAAGADEDDGDVVLVRPQRSQIRSVLIFAVPRPAD